MVVSDVDEEFYEITEFNNSEWNQFKKSSKENNTTKSVTLDKIITKYIDNTDDFILIKMDIEGNEPLALKGLKEFINLNVNIMLEFHVGVLEKMKVVLMNLQKNY
jgi:FkbM family methyltransferase